MHEVPPLNYRYSDLEPHIDEETMRLHHLKHHQAYVDKLNVALEQYPDLANKSVEELLKDLNQVPEAIRTAVRNNGGGHYNHCQFWEMISPSGATPREQTLNLFDQYFGGLDEFKKRFKATALAQFGSGWAWLVIDPHSGGKLEIISTSNQDTPLSSGQIILLGLDVWEHAYYLKYQNRRADYIDAFWQVIDWEKLERAIVSK